MKKFIVIAVAALLAVPAFANPKVGDKADFKLTATKGDKVMAGVASLELMALDAAKKEFTQRLTLQWAGKAAEANDEKIAAADMLTDTVIDQVLTAAGCAAEGGKLEKITVPAGAIDVCTVSGTDQEGVTHTSSIGKVTLGLVKYVQSANGLSIAFELVAHKAGK